MKYSIYLIIVFSIVTVPLQAASSKVQPPTDIFDKSIYNWSRVLAEAFNLVKTKYYVKDLDPQDALINAISAFVHLDPHSTFLDPKSYKQLLQATNGEFFGIGVAIGPKLPDDEFLMIIEMIPGGPAEAKGVKAGDKIISVDDMVLRGLTTEEVSAKLKGPKNTPVTIKILREHYPEPLVLTIMRDVVKEQSSFCYLFKDLNICYLHLNMFTTNAVNQLSSLLKKAQKQQYKGIILDLRGNTGGLVNSAVDIAELFLDSKSLVATTKDRNNAVTESYVTQKNPLNVQSLPIFVLVNNFTASAAEILAGCLKVHSEKIAAQSGSKKQNKLLVFIVGTRTFGKGSVQELIPISNDCAIKLTVALYFLPNDITVQGIGIEPDIKIEQKFPPTEHMKWVQNSYGQESALKNTIKVHKKAEEKSKKQQEDEAKKNWKLRRKEAIANDSQIRDTMTCINILHTNQDKWKNRNDAIKFINSIFVNDSELVLEEIEG